MDSVRLTMIGAGIVIVAATVFALGLIIMPRKTAPSAPPPDGAHANFYRGEIPVGTHLRAPITGTYPGGNANGLNPDMQKSGG